MEKAVIADFVERRFPDSTLVFYEDRDRSGYTFEQREGCQAMRRELVSHKKDILIIKDFSRFVCLCMAGLSPKTHVAQREHIIPICIKGYS